jgi:hypothetical protein
MHCVGTCLVLAIYFRAEEVLIIFHFLFYVPFGPDALEDV